MWRCAVLCAALLLVACAPTPASRATTATDAPPPATVSATTPAVPASEATAQPVASSTPPSDTSDPATISRACRVDADCAVKNVGSCCGQYPACVNKDAATDPAGVRARCGKEHRMGICSVPAVAGCSCVAGQCKDINAADVRPAH